MYAPLTFKTYPLLWNIKLITIKANTSCNILTELLHQVQISTTNFSKLYFDIMQLFYVLLSHVIFPQILSTMIFYAVLILLHDEDLFVSCDTYLVKYL
jgi:hypothetical protein